MIGSRNAAGLRAKCEPCITRVSSTQAWKKMQSKFGSGAHMYINQTEL